MPEYGDLIPIKEFRAHVKSGMFTPDDGSGYYAKAGQMSHISVWRNDTPEWATHVAWFNK